MEKEDSAFRKLTECKSFLNSCSLWLTGFLLFQFSLGIHMKDIFQLYSSDF